MIAVQILWGGEGMDSRPASYILRQVNSSKVGDLRQDVMLFAVKLSFAG